MTTTSESPVVVAIDGPSGSGKSSVSRRVAHVLDLHYLDTGAMYRSLAWFCLDRNVDISDVDAVTNAAKRFRLVVSTEPDDQQVSVAGTDVTDEIRQPFIAAVVSEVARIAGVRQELIRRQRNIVAEACADGSRDGIIVEGRDITTVVCPDAPVRILLTARDEVRLARRGAELKQSGYAEASSVEAGEKSPISLATQVVERDRKDSVVNNFSSPAPGVVLVDSSEIDFDQTVKAVLDVVAAKRQQVSAPDA